MYIPFERFLLLNHTMMPIQLVLFNHTLRYEVEIFREFKVSGTNVGVEYVYNIYVHIHAGIYASD